MKAELILEDGQQASITIYNMLGELVKQQNLHTGVTTIDVTELKSGTYFYTIVTDGKNDQT